MPMSPCGCGLYLPPPLHFRKNSVLTVHSLFGCVRLSSHFGWVALSPQFQIPLQLLRGSFIYFLQFFYGLIYNLLSYQIWPPKGFRGGLNALFN